jgi:O-methyltransferase involved in polyketide biosynthesis
VPENVTLQAQTIQETMLLPLWGRARFSRLYPELLVDPHAARIVENLDYDFSAMAEALDEYWGISFLVRARRFDESITAYIAEHPQATIINLGAGLDTTFSRVDNGRIRWYDLDMPDAIAFRKRLIPETEHSTCIARSAFDQTWFDEIAFDQKLGLFVIAGGLFMYFDQTEVRPLLVALAERFPNGEILFDAMSGLGKAVINWQLRGTGVPKTRFALGNSCRTLASWSPRLDVVESTVYYGGVSRDPRWRQRTRLMFNVIDGLRMGKFVHVRFLPLNTDS